jgi:hypothetical protein
LKERIAELKKELETLAKLPIVVHKTKEVKTLSIAIVEASTMNETSMVSSLSMDLSQFVFQEPFNVFEKHTRGNSSKHIRQMGYNDQELGKRSQGIVNLLVAISIDSSMKA